MNEPFSALASADNPITPTPGELPRNQDGALAPSGGGYDPTRQAAELAVIDALRGVLDPELGIDVIELGLIKEIVLGAESSEIKMVLTTPFCPYAGSLIAQIQAQAEIALAQSVKVTVLAQLWDPRDAGLIW